MVDVNSEISQLLKDCERTGCAPLYETGNVEKDKKGLVGYPKPIDFRSEGSDVFVVSDLHLATGTLPDGRYEGCENFFFDAEFRRFLNYADNRKTSAKAILIINGDFVDFLRVTTVPGRGPKLKRLQTVLRQLKLKHRESRLAVMSEKQQREFLNWSRILRRIGVDMSAEILAASITDKEEIYGLKTQSYKSVLRLDAVIRGHTGFFRALAEWLERGHRLVVVKGNHDLEWYWLDVRNYLRLALARRVACRNGDLSPAGVKHAVQEVVLPNLTFVDHALIIDKSFYVEHGHRFDSLTRVIGYDTVNNGQELNIPFGSFINRYLLDYIELKYPYLDNIRPTPNILPMMLRHKFFTGLRLLWDHLSVLAKTIPRGYVHSLFGQSLFWIVVTTLGVLIAPPIISLILWRASLPGYAWITLLAAWPLLSYAGIQALGYLQIKEPDSLADYARTVFDDHSEYSVITFGHTHNPDQFRDSSREQDRWFYNSGTWMPIIETTAESLRENKTFMFIHLASDGGGSLKPGVLERWDDDALRAEPLVMIRGQSPDRNPPE